MRITQYSHLDDMQLTNLFSTRSWFALTPKERMDACQEVENRLANDRGMPARLVQARAYNGSVYGEQSGDRIYLNESVLTRGVFLAQDRYDPSIVYEIPCPASNWQTLDTIYHEDTHGMLQDSGQGQGYASYIEPATDGTLYRIQPEERMAFDAGHRNTLEAMDRVERSQGQPDAGRQAYEAAVEADSYEEAVAEARDRYADPAIDQTLEQVVNDRENGITPLEKGESYQNLEAVYEQQELRRAQERAAQQAAARSAQQEAKQDQAQSAEAGQGNDQSHGYGMG